MNSFEIKEIINLYLHEKLSDEKRKRILKSFDKASVDCQEIIVKTFSDELIGILSLSVSEVNKKTEVMEILISFLDNSVMGNRLIETNLLRILQYYIDCGNIFARCLRSELDVVEELQMINTVHKLLQSLISVIEKSFSFKISDLKLLRCLYCSVRNLFVCDKIPIDTLYNCGQLLIILDYNYLQIASSIWLFKNSKTVAPAKCLALCYGFLVNIPIEILMKKIFRMCSLLIAIMDSIFDIFKRYPNDCSLLTGILKFLLLFTQRVTLRKDKLPSYLLKMLISFLWTHLDHFLDIIKNLSRVCLNNIISQKDDDVNTEILNLIRVGCDIDRKTCTILSRLCTVMPVNVILSHHKRLIEDLINTAGCNNQCSYISRTYVSLMVSSFDGTDFENWFDTWIKHLFCIGDRIHLFSEPILIAAVKVSPLVLEKLHPLANRTNYQLLMKCFLATRRMSLVCFSWYDRFPITLMKNFLRVPSNESANTTISFILESCKGTNNLNDELVELFKIYINSNMNNVDVAQRQTLFSRIRKIFTFIRTISDQKRNQSNNECNAFIEWTVSSCFNNLFIGASFARRQTALRIFEILTGLNLWTLENCSADEVCTILLCSADLFEENKRLSINLLLPTLRKHDFFNENKLDSLYCLTADLILDVNFSDHSTAAYLLELLCSNDHSGIPRCLPSAFLNHMTDECEEFRNNSDILRGNETKNLHFIHVFTLTSLLKMRLKYIEDDKLATKPLNGFLHVIRHLFKCLETKNLLMKEEWKKLIADVVKTCIECNVRAMSVVSQSSPEGYLPEEELSEISDDLNYYTSSQRIVVCSWRTIKESSLLLGFIVTRFGVAENAKQGVFLEKNLFLSIGTHLNLLLFEIKHKGALNQVNIAMNQFCRCCWRYPDNTVNAIPKLWLMETVERIVTNCAELCVTRRSAGIPYIVVAILSTEYDGMRKWKSVFFDTFMKRVIEICENVDSTIDSKVHAMNILRTVFKNKDFADVIDDYVEKCFIMAIAGVKSSFWNIRNVSWLLLGSIINRIFGIQLKSKTSGKTFFRKYPLLFEFFLSGLRECQHSEINAQSSLYVILLVFAKFNSAGDYDRCDDNFELKLFVPFIMECSRSMVWKIRQKAAFAIIPFISPNAYVNHVRALWTHVEQSVAENHMHGLLLQLEVTLKNVSRCETKAKEKLLELLAKIFCESFKILNSEKRNFVVKRQLFAVMTRILKIYSCEGNSFDILSASVVDIVRDENSRSVSTKENASRKIDENEYVRCKAVFDICALYCLDFADRKTEKQCETNFADIVKNVFEKCFCVELWKTRCVLLEFIYSVVSKREEDGDANGHELLQNKIIRDIVQTDFDKSTLIRDFFINNRIVYSFLSNCLTLNRCAGSADGTFKDGAIVALALHILCYFVKCEYFQPVETNLIAKLCSECHGNVTVLLSLIRYIDTCFSCASIYNSDDRLRIMRILFDITYLSVSSKLLHHELVIFYFRNKNTLLLCDVDILGLDICTLILQNSASSPDLEMQILHLIDDDANGGEQFPVLNLLLNESFAYLRQKPVVYAVALVSWILADIGVEWDDLHNTNVIFTENVSECFENYLILSRLSSALLRNLLKSNPDLLLQPLDEMLLSWITQHCALDKESSITCLNDIISLISRKYSAISETVTDCFSFLRANISKTHFSLNKMSLLLSCS